MDAAASSIFAKDARCTSSGPSAMRSVRAAAHSLARQVSCTAAKQWQLYWGRLPAEACAPSPTSHLTATAPGATCMISWKRPRHKHPQAILALQAHHPQANNAPAPTFNAPPKSNWIVLSAHVLTHNCHVAITVWLWNVCTPPSPRRFVQPFVFPTFAGPLLSLVRDML